MLPILQIGPLAIQVPGLLLLAGLWLGLTLSEQLLQASKQRHMRVQDVSNVALLSLGIGLVGARIGYALQFPSAFSNTPLDLISLSPALLDPWLGTFAALMAAIAIIQRKQLPAALVLDVFTPLLACLVIAWFLSNLASGNGYGLPTHLPWGIDLFGALRHPAQFYDSLAAASVLGFIWLQRRKTHLGKANLFVTFLALTSASRLFLEAFHATGATVLDGWRVTQIAAWTILAASLLFLRKNSQWGEFKLFFKVRK